MDISLKDKPVQTIRLVRSYEGDVPRYAKGRIEYTQENGVGRTLARVRWEEQKSSMVLFEDIEFLNE